MNAMLDLEFLLDHAADRARGIDSSRLTDVGRSNLRRLLELAQQAAQRALFDVTADERKERAAGIAELKRLVDSTTVERPLLPRLRNESFREGERVVVWLGDTPGLYRAASGWVHGVIQEVSKSYRKQWDTGEPNGGWYWRLTAEVEIEILPDRRAVAFSTSEPRAIAERDWAWLTQACKEDPDYVAMFAENANRPWTPLWCSELGVDVQGEMDMAAWLRSATHVESV